MAPLDRKERLKLPRQQMPAQDPLARITNFEEVNFGFTPNMAMLEAQRCLFCPKPPCVAGCPVNINIPSFISLIAEGKFTEAAKKIKETNSLPAICGRVCPQEEQCEGVCVIGKKGTPVAIGHLERFAADWERTHGEVTLPEKKPSTGKKVAVVGSGPSGLTVASELVQMGHSVTVFEALHVAGGVLAYGIPEFRLPKGILGSEVDYLKSLGVEVVTDFVVGKTSTLDELLSEGGYDAAFVGSGAGLPVFTNIPGENLNGVYSANEYLTRTNLMKSYLFPEYDTPIAKAKNVAVFGGGNTAMDAVRTAKRFGTEHAYLIYRRSWDEMPARLEERHHAKEEGIEFMFLTAPTKFIGDENGWVKGVECIKMELGEPDASGRRRPVPVKGSEFVVDIELAVIAVGNGSNPLIPLTTPDIQTNKWGNIIVKEKTTTTTKTGVFAGGDIVRGGATVILAMGDGKQAAQEIDAYLKSK